MAFIGSPQPSRLGGAEWKFEARAGLQWAPPCCAAHYILDDEPRILADPFARPFAGFASDKELLNTLETRNPPDFPRMRAVFALRNRYAEDELSQAVQEGVSQYVILGAGLDSFTFRHPELMRKLAVYEVDHPASQAWKRDRLAQMTLEIPTGLHFVSIDFERETLAEALQGDGFFGSAKSFFSWLGVTQYLTPEAVLQTLREIREAAAPGSELVMQFIVPVTSLSDAEGALVAELARGAAEVGEPRLSYFEPEDLERHLRHIGFGQIHHFGVKDAADRYLLSRSDGLSLPRLFPYGEGSHYRAHRADGRVGSDFSIGCCFAERHMRGRHR
jgi:methyltransferase (TIGR00027 family)